VFTSHHPARDDGFRDRRAEVARLDAAVDLLRAGRPKWIALIGPRKIGKTSLLGEVARRRRDPALAFVLYDVFEAAPPSIEVVRTLALRAADQALGAALGASLEALAPRPGDYRAVLAGAAAFARLPPAVRTTLLELPDAALDAARVRACLELPEQLAAALGLHVVVAIDEFQELTGVTVGAGRGKGDLVPLLRAVWQHHRRVAYVISGSAPTMLLELVTSERSPFFHHFEVMELGPFAEADAIALLVDDAPPGRAIPPAVARRAVALFGGHPFYLQLLGEALTAQPGAIDEPALKQAVGDLLFSSTGRLALYFTAEYQRLVGRSASLAAVLAALAPGPLRLGELATAIRAATGAAAAYVGRLGDAVVRDGDHHRIADPVFARWLAWRAPGGAAVPMATIGDEAERRVADELARLGFDLVYQSRASRGAFDLLATRGTAQLGVQVKRTKLPASVAAAAWKRMRAESARLGWDFVVAAVTPDDVVHFLDPARIGAGGAPRLRATAAIDNLLAWLDERTYGARRARPATPRAPRRRAPRAVR
jgi:AAA+ ATPase superfamily predicted ATPase